MINNYEDWDDPVGLEAPSPEEVISDFKRALDLHIQKAIKKRDGTVQLMKSRIEQAELDMIAKEFEEEERQRRLEKLGRGNWA